MAGAKRKRVAVIGGGVAGLGAAWSLSKVHDVVLYEASEYIGGHAYTHHWVDADGNDWPVDMAFMVFHPWVFPNLTALFQRFGVSTVATGGSTIATIVNGESWCVGHDSAAWLRVKEEAYRLERDSRDILAQPEQYVAMSVREYLTQKGYSDEFVWRFLMPNLSKAFLTKLFFDAPAYMLALIFGPVPLMSFFFPVPWMAVDNGSENYVNAVLADMDADVRTNTPVSRVRTTGKGVTVEVDGESEHFDEVVMAADAETALALLEDPTPTEREILGAFTYEHSEGILHTDASVMPPERELWSDVCTVIDGENYPPDQMYYSYWITPTQPWLKPDVFETFSPPEGLIDPETIITTRKWKHMSHTRDHALASGELHRIQGTRGIWYCGGYASTAIGHEFSLTTGLVVATALGAPYPFEQDKNARVVFYDHAVHHMKLLPASAYRDEPLVFRHLRLSENVAAAKKAVFTKMMAQRVEAAVGLAPRERWWSKGIARLASRALYGRVSLLRAVREEDERQAAA